MTKDVATSQTAPGYVHYPRYSENGSIRSWGALGISVGAPIAAVATLVVGAADNINWLLIPGFACVIIAFTSMGVRACWGVGIRIDETGIMIGGCKRASRWWWHAWQRIRIVSGPSTTRPTTYTLFVPWDGIRSVRVASERHDINQLIRHAPKRRVGRASDNTLRYFFQVGVVVPFYAAVWYNLSVRGFLVFDIDVNQAQVPHFRSPSRQIAMPPSSTWICPTRKPKKLGKVVEELQPLLNR